ncbi:MAG: hypothetical protein JOZ18_20815, partial [Chloroflexi bacterium]|nr:hypothetical protein [Chloroflexota bacterium]
MKITVTGGLTLGYLSKLSRYNYVATASAAFIVIVSLYWMLFHIGRASGTTLFANAVYTLAAAIAAIWALQIAYLARYGAIQLAPRHQLAWLLIGLALLANTLKGAYYGYQEYTIGHNPFPSYSDILSNLFYPLIFAGLIFMPARTRFRPRMAFDAIITTLCFLGVSWFFVIGPAYFAKAGTLNSSSELLKLITALSYPCWGILLIVALTLLIERGTAPVLRLSLLLICVSIIANLWASTAHAYMCFFTDTYQTG